MIIFLSLFKKTDVRISVFFFFWRHFAKLDSEKNEFDLHKGFLVEKITQIRQISKKHNLKIARFLS
jgi:hypothetical protein